MMRPTVVLAVGGFIATLGLLLALVWFFYTAYLKRVERRLAARKSLYRALVSELDTRDGALLDPIIHQMKTLRDLETLEAALEEQARSTPEGPDWLLDLYDKLGLVDKYIEKLRRAGKWRDRAFAAELLGRVGGAKAVPALLETAQAVRTEDSDVREIALRALARIADPRAVGPLVEALSSADPWLTARIAEILASHGDAVVDPLIELLTHSSCHPARAWAAHILGEVRAQRAFPALVRGLGDADDEVRGRSATALGRLGDRRAVNHLLERLLTDPVPFVRARIAATLGQFGGPEVIDRLIRALRDPAWWVRVRSVEALERIGPAAEAPLLVALDDPDREIRSRVAAGLERLGVADELARAIEAGQDSTDATELLIRLCAAGTPELLRELVRHPSPKVREAVITAIRQGRRTDLAGELMQTASQDIDPSLRALALETLRSLRFGKAVVAATTRLADSDERVRTAAIRLIGELGGQDSVQLLREQTGAPEAAVRSVAARALGALGAGSAQTEFFMLLGDLDPTVRKAALIGAAEAGIRPLVPAIIKLLDDDDIAVRCAAAEALGVLGGELAVPALLRVFPPAPPALREAILAAVTRLDVGAVHGLIEALLQSPDAESQIAVTRTLANLRVSGSVNVLDRLSRSPQPWVRVGAIEALGRCGRVAGRDRDICLSVVAAGLRDPHEDVRAGAIDAGVRLGLEDEGRTVIGLLANDPSVRVRERAALAIGILRIPGGEGPLIAACRRTESASVRVAAALAAGALDPGSLVIRFLEMPDEWEVRELLRQRLKGDPRFRLLARKLSRVRALELHALAAAEQEGPAYLATGLRSTLETGERVRVISGLGAFRGEQSLNVLLQVVREDPSPEVRTAALTTAGPRLDIEERFAQGVRALGDPSPLVRRAAVDLFSTIAAERGFPRLIRALRSDEGPEVLARVADLAAQEFTSFRDATSALPLTRSQTVLLVRMARFVQHPELSSLVSPLAGSVWPEVREEVADVGRQRPEALKSDALEALTADPVKAVRHAAAGAAAAAERYDLLDKMTQDPDVGVRRQVAIALGRSALVGKSGIAILERLGLDTEMPVRAAAYIARLLQGTPVPLPPGVDPNAAADAVRDASDVSSLRKTARGRAGEDRRLAAALALAMLLDDVAREVARMDPIPAIRHRVSGALELAMQGTPGNTA
jgi:HEAT repeat protein